MLLLLRVIVVRRLMLRLYYTFPGLQDLQEFQEIFNLVDTDRGGSIGTEELARPASATSRDWRVPMCVRTQIHVSSIYVHIYIAC